MFEILPIPTSSTFRSVLAASMVVVLIEFGVDFLASAAIAVSSALMSPLGEPGLSDSSWSRSCS